MRAQAYQDKENSAARRTGTHEPTVHHGASAVWHIWFATGQTDYQHLHVKSPMYFARPFFTPGWDRLGPRRCPRVKASAAYQGGLNVVKDFNHIKLLLINPSKPLQIFILYIDLRVKSHSSTPQFVSFRIGKGIFRNGIHFERAREIECH